MASSSDAPHLPRSAPIEAYGKGGFAFADMSHRGSLLCLPSGIYAWPVTEPARITMETLGPVLAEADRIGLLLIGTGPERWPLPAELLSAFASRTRDSAATACCSNAATALPAAR